MAEKSAKSEGTEKSFAQFVRGAPSATEAGWGTVTLTGTVMRSDKEDTFILVAASGQTIELSIDAVRQYHVTQEAGPQQVVQLQVAADRLLEGQAAKFKEITKDPINDVATLKESPKDPLVDTFKEPLTDPLIDTFKEPTTDTFKESTTDPLIDPGTHPRIDLVKTPGLDTIQETIGQGLPGGGVVNPPQGGVAGPGAVPFVMATPHHAPGAAVMMQQAAGLGGAQLTAKEVTKDPAFDPIGTFKEVVKDPLQDPITLKEVTKDPLTDPITWVETINPGTLAEGINPTLPGGGVINPPVWNLPGLMF